MFGISQPFFTLFNEEWLNAKSLLITKDANLTFLDLKVRGHQQAGKVNILSSELTDLVMKALNASTSGFHGR